MGCLGELTTEQKTKAFENTRDNFIFPDAKLVLVTEEYYDAALQLAQVFSKDETVNRSLNLEWSEEYKELCMSTLRHNLSLMIVHSKTGEPMALRMIRVMKSSEGFDPSGCKDEDIKKIVQFLDVVDKKVKFFDEMGCTETIHFFTLCVAEKYRNRGLASKIFEAALNMIRYFELDSVCIRGKGTSNYSKRIYEKFGFQTLYEIQFSDYLVNGEQVFCNTGEDKSMKIFGTEILK